jgi:two-component system, OmpR family, KDP operon response regulator KdpE
MASEYAPILLIDDDGDLRGALRLTLQAEGYEVVEAADGKAALHLMVGGNPLEPSLIVLDMQMPGMSGWEFLAVVRSYVRLKTTPVIVLSGRAPNAETMSRGAVSAWIQKPADFTELLDVVKAHARRRVA